MICTRDFLTAILYRPTKTLASFSTAKGSRINRLASFLLMPAPISIFNALFRFMPSPPSQRLAHGKQCLGESVCGNAIIEKAARESSNGIENLLTTKVCFVCSEIAVAGCLAPHKPICTIAAISAGHQQLNCTLSCHGTFPPFHVPSASAPYVPADRRLRQPISDVLLLSGDAGNQLWHLRYRRLAYPAFSV